MDNNNAGLVDDGLLGIPSFIPEEKPKKVRSKLFKRIVASLIAAVILAAGGITAWILLAPEAVAEEKTFKEYTAAMGDIRVSYEVDGVISLPFSYADAEYSAEILGIYVQKGDSFKKGDLLAELDDSTLIANVDSAQETVLSAQDSLRDAKTGVQTAISAVSDAESSVNDARMAVDDAVAAIADAVAAVGDSVAAVDDAVAAVEDAKRNVTSAERNVVKQEAAYQSAVDGVEEAALKKQLNILSQKQTISDVEAQIEQAKKELSLMEEFSDEYSANEILNKKNSLASLEIKLNTEKNNLTTLEKETTDTTVINAQTSLEDAKDSLEKAKINVTKAEANVTKAETNVTKAEANVAKVEANVPKAEANVVKAEKNVQTAKDNVTKAQNNVEKAERTLEKAQKALDEARENLSSSKIIAPCDGVVIAVNKAVGEMAQAVAAGSGSTGNSLIVYTTDDAAYIAKASIPELDLAQVYEGQIARVTVEALDEATFEGEVSDISNFASSGSNNVVSYQATVKFDPKGEELFDQMNCSIVYITKEVTGVINVPNDAVYVSDGKSYVTVKNSDGTTEERVVTTGFSDGSTCEIKSGLRQGETVVSKTATNSARTETSNNNLNERGGAAQSMPGMITEGGPGGGGGGMVFRIG